MSMAAFYLPYIGSFRRWERVIRQGWQEERKWRRRSTRRRTRQGRRGRGERRMEDNNRKKVQG